MSIPDQVISPVQIIGPGSGAGTPASEASQDAAVLALQTLTNNRVQHYGLTAGSANAYTLTIPGFTEAVGTRLSFRCHAANTGATTLQINGGTVRGIFNHNGGGTQLVSGDLVASLSYEVELEASGWILQQDSAAGLTIHGTTVMSNTARNIGPTSGSSTRTKINYPTGGGIDISENGITFCSWESSRLVCGTIQGLTSSTSLHIATRTNDSADDQYLTLQHGTLGAVPGATQSRGAAFWSYGNEHANTGRLALCAGSNASASVDTYDHQAVLRTKIDNTGLNVISTGATGGVVSVGTSFTTVRAVTGTQVQLTALVTGKGSIIMDWDGTTLTKVTGPASLVVAGSAGAGETAFRMSAGNLQAIVDTGTRNVSGAFSIRH